MTCLHTLVANCALVPVTSLLVALSGCAATPVQTDWHDRDSYAGWITDASTGNPIEGVVVVAVWGILRRNYTLVAEGNPDKEIIRLEETLTDKEGRFQFSPLGYYDPPFGWQRDEVAFPLLRIFKPGYLPAGRTRFTWEHGDQLELAAHSSANQARKEGWQREIRVYPYGSGPVSEVRATNPIYMKLTPEQKILDPLRSFASFLVSNLGNSATDLRSQRRTAEKQWRAMVMVDDEIRKYLPNYEWPNATARQMLSGRERKEERR